MCSKKEDPAPGVSTQSLDHMQSANSVSGYYDHVMMLEDKGSSGGDGGSVARESKLSKVSFLVMCTFVSMFGGFALNLAVSGRRFRAAVKTTANPKNIDKQKIPVDVELEDPVLLATRALGWGSLYAVLGSGAIGLGAYYLFRV